MSRNWIWWRIIQMFVNTVFLWGAFLLAYFVRVNWIFSSDFDFHIFAKFAFFSAIIWNIFLIFIKFYNVIPSKNLLPSILKILAGGIIVVGFLLITYFFKTELFFSRLINIYIFVFGSSVLFISELIFREILAWQRKHNCYYKTIIIGANRITEKIINDIEKDRFAPYEIIGIIDPYGLPYEKLKKRVLGKLDTLEKYCHKFKINCIIQCDGLEHSLNIISFCAEKNIKFQFDPCLRNISDDNLRIRKVANNTMISFVNRTEKKKKSWFKIVDWTLNNVFDVD